MKKAIRIFLAYCMACFILLWRLTCRYRAISDPRPALRKAGQPYVMALLHAHQLNALFLNDERRLSAMVSRSADGDWLAPLLILRRVKPVRGSTRKNGEDKGGQQALAKLKNDIYHHPILLAVDGPRGPRNYVNRGVYDLAVTTNAAIVPIRITADKHWILKKTWDLFQIPKPFSTVSISFGEVLYPKTTDNVAEVQEKVSKSLRDLERDI